MDGRPVTIVHVVAELAPFARTGGLGEAVASLARFQRGAGLDVAVLMPWYGEVQAKRPRVLPVGDPFTVRVAGREERGQLLELVRDAPATQPRILFVANGPYFDRSGIYGDSRGDFADNARRYAFFCLAALQALPRLADGPVVLHAHDWHTALAPVYLRSWYRGSAFHRGVATVLSVHNAGFQGHFPTETMGDLGLPWELYNLHQLEWYGRVNFLKGGMAFADVVTTVSPSHARELRTPDGGFGLHEAFAALGSRFVGIVNGIDTTVWDPARDAQIPARFAPEALAGKATCKAALQAACGLPARGRTPLFGMSARMVYQKGLDLILGSGFLGLDAQFVFLGAGEARYERALAELAQRHPERIGVQLRFTDAFEHLVMAGADLCLMPSMYEPCGLTQMRAQRYGALPLARRVGGLADTIEDGVTGFLFDGYTPESFLEGAARAVHAYHDPPRWAAMQREAMSRDFSWVAPERRYAQVYREALARHRPRAAAG